MMTLKKVKAGSEPGEPIVVKQEDFEAMFWRTTGERTYCLDSQAVYWAKNGRLGSRFQVGGVMYIKVLDKKDDPFKYYTPEQKSTTAGYISKTDCCGGSGACSSGGGSCSSGGGGCSGGSCKH